MSTLVEIEKMVSGWPVAQQQDLLHWLKQRLLRHRDGVQGQASQWLRGARGAICVTVHESPDELRMDYYQERYGLE